MWRLLELLVGLARLSARKRALVLIGAVDHIVYGQLPLTIEMEHGFIILIHGCMVGMVGRILGDHMLGTLALSFGMEVLLVIIIEIKVAIFHFWGIALL